ncbi:hypothetical protein BGW42_005981 [Actinomortierella wolfii]|nr:hypothetical protein BGW42_005981 [Actinomortierella wolfii]
MDSASRTSTTGTAPNVQELAATPASMSPSTSHAPSTSSPYDAHAIHAPPLPQSSTTHFNDIYIGDYSGSDSDSTRTTSTTANAHHAPSPTQPPAVPSTIEQDTKDPLPNTTIDLSSSFPYAPQHLRQLEEEKYRIQQHEERLERQHLEEQRLQQQQQLQGRQPAEDDQVYEMSSMSPVPAYQSAIFDDSVVLDPVASKTPQQRPVQILQPQQQSPHRGQVSVVVDPFVSSPAPCSDPSPNRPSESSSQRQTTYTTESGDLRRSRRTHTTGDRSSGVSESSRRMQSRNPSAQAATASTLEQYRDGALATEKPLSFVDRFRILAGYPLRQRHQQHPSTRNPGMLGASQISASRLSSRSDLMEGFSARSSPRYPRSSRSGVTGSPLGWRRSGLEPHPFQLEYSREEMYRNRTDPVQRKIRKTGAPGKNGQEPETDLFKFVDILLDIPDRPSWRDVITTLAKVLAVMAISYFALMALYFAAEFQAAERMNNIDVVVVDFDISMVGSEFIQYTQSVNNNPRKINWVVDYTTYENQQQVMDDVESGKYWGAVVIQPNSSRSLFNALTYSNKNYDPTKAFTMIYDGGRNPLVTKPIVVSGIYMHFVDFIKTFNSKWIFTVLSLAEDGNQTLTSLIDTPWVLGTPVAFQEIDLHPPTASILSSATTVAYIWVFLVAGGSTYFVANAIQPMTRHVSVLKTMVYLLTPLMVFLTVLSFVYSLLLLTFGVPFNGLSQFLALFGSMLLLQCSVSALVLFLIFLVPVVYIPSITITYVIMNVIAVFNSVELMPTFYRWAYAMPFLNAVQMARYVLMGSYNRLASNIPIMFAWIVMPITLLPFAIARQKRLMSEVEERELREQELNRMSHGDMDDEKHRGGSGFSSHRSRRSTGTSPSRGNVRRRGAAARRDEGHLSNTDDDSSFISDDEEVYETSSERGSSHYDDESQVESNDDGDEPEERYRQEARSKRAQVVVNGVTSSRNANPFATPPCGHNSGASVVTTMVAPTAEHPPSTRPELSVPRGPVPYVAPMPPKTFASASASAPPIDTAFAPCTSMRSGFNSTVVPSSASDAARSSQGSHSTYSDNSHNQGSDQERQPTSSSTTSTTAVSGDASATAATSCDSKERHVPTHRPTPSTSSSTSTTQPPCPPPNTALTASAATACGSSNSSSSSSSSSSGSHNHSPDSNNSNAESSSSGSGSGSNAYTQTQQAPIHNAVAATTSTSLSPAPVVSVPMPVLKRQPYASELTADLNEIK